MPIDYETVGAFYESLAENLSAFVARIGEKEAFCGDRDLQISRKELDLQGGDPVFCPKTALAAFDAIVEQGEGAQARLADSHYCRFLAIREELRALKAANRRSSPPGPPQRIPCCAGRCGRRARVDRERRQPAATVDLANSAYALMLRLISHSYLVPRPHPDKALCVDLALGLMRAMTPLAERAARLPAGPSNPGCNARHVVHRAARLRAAASGRERGELLRRAAARAHGGRAGASPRAAIRASRRRCGCSSELAAARRAPASRNSTSWRRPADAGGLPAPAHMPAAAAAPHRRRRAARRSSSRATLHPRPAPSTASTTSRAAISR